MDCETWERLSVVDRKQLQDNSALDPRFTHFYNSGERVEVTYKWGETERFYVGKSTGWKPIYLTIKRIDSSGGAGLLCDSVVKIQPLGIYQN